MSLNSIPAAERTHIAFFGLRNAGKSSLVNAVTNQQLSLVSEIKGTTTDPVKKTMEILPLGPVVIIDTPGIDDSGDLGKLRVKKALDVLSETDIAILVVDAEKGIGNYDKKLIENFKAGNTPFVIAYNKSDLISFEKACAENEIYVSAKENKNIFELKEMLGKLCEKNKNDKTLLGDLVSANDLVILVTPIDESAPKGRMILPQQQTIRAILDSDAICITVKETQLQSVLEKIKIKPKIVITDSQAFSIVKKLLPEDIPLTSFSILFARYKGDLQTVVKGAFKLDNLKDGDTVLISEACTHHRQCNDIGTVKLPKLIKNYTKKELSFEFTSGGEFPEDVSKYALIVHCGGCMINEKEMQSRIDKANKNGIPFSNYGITLAQINGILRRAIEPFSLELQ